MNILDVPRWEDAVNVSPLREFAVLAEVRNYSKAASLLGFEQSSLSKKIVRLEKELGFELFARTTRSVELTEAGKEFYRDVSELLDAYDKSVEKGRAISRKAGSKLVLGGYWGNSAIDGLIEAAQTLAAGRELSFVLKLDSRRLYQTDKARPIDPFDAVLAGVHDVSVVYSSKSIEKAGLGAVTLLHDPAVAFVRADEGFEQDQFVDLSDFADWGIVEGNNYRTYQERVTEICEEAGFAPKKKLRVYNDVNEMATLSRRNEVLVIPESTRSPIHLPALSGMTRLRPNGSASFEVVAIFRPDNRKEQVAECVELLAEAARLVAR